MAGLRECAAPARRLISGAAAHKARHSMKTAIVIPARLGSTRLPRKPLADIAGRAMILRVADAAKAADIGPVLIAAGEEEIAEAARAAGYEAVLTDPDLPSGTDRVLAALQAADPDRECEAVINLQGDLPDLDPAVIRAALEAVTGAEGVDIGTLATENADAAKRDDPNAVKAVLALEAGGRRGRALYFTRATAPWGEGPIYKHVGIYAFRRAALERFCALPPSPLEKRERLEQLRALENGMRIDALLIDDAPDGVDTPEDLERLRARLSAKET